MDGSYTWLANSGVNGLVADGLTDGNVAVMNNMCGIYFNDKYFLYDSGVIKELKLPTSGKVQLEFVSGAGFGGLFYNTHAQQYNGFAVIGNKLKLATFPLPSGSTYMAVTAIGPHNEVAGYLVDAANYCHGFIYSNKTYHVIDYPGHESTLIAGFSSTGAIIGYFDDQNVSKPTQAFVATCATDSGCMR